MSRHKKESISSVYLFFFSIGKQATMLIESSSIPKSVMLLVGVTVLYGSIGTLFYYSCVNAFSAMLH